MIKCCFMQRLHADKINPDIVEIYPVIFSAKYLLLIVPFHKLQRLHKKFLLRLNKKLYNQYLLYMYLVFVFRFPRNMHFIFSGFF